MLRGKKILITSGPTQAPLDAVRYLTNVSTGRFGTLLAREALRRGAHVTFVNGQGSETPKAHRNLACIPAITNQDVAHILRRELQRSPRKASDTFRGGYDIVIHAMAVLDFAPAAVRKTKTTSRRKGWTIHLKPTHKIITRIKKWSPGTLLVGFKLETGWNQKELLRRARRLLKESRADFVLANQLTEGEDRCHAGWLLDASGQVIAHAKGKRRLAKLILGFVDRACAAGGT